MPCLRTIRSFAVGPDKDILADTVFHVPENLAWRDVDSQMVVLDLTSGEYVTFNDLGRRIWLSVVEGKQVGRIAEEVVQEYDVAQEQALRDIREFLAGLAERRMLSMNVL